MKVGKQVIGGRKARISRDAALLGLAISLACGAVEAERNTAQFAARSASHTAVSNSTSVRKEAKVGMFTGAAAGAAVGGPIGAAVGFFVGGVIGDGAGMTSEAQQRSGRLENDLTATRLALARATEEADNDAVLAGLSERLSTNVLFKTGSSQVQGDIAVRLEEVGAILAARQTLTVQLHGFADPRGSAQYNLELSRERVGAVRAALIRGGAAESQIEDSAHGAELNTASQGDLEAYAWERRVSIAIVSTPSQTSPQAVASAN